MNMFKSHCVQWGLFHDCIGIIQNECIGIGVYRFAACIPSWKKKETDICPCTVNIIYYINPHSFSLPFILLIMKLQL